jgi:hypothetical protein
MKLKTVITVILLVFVAASGAYLVFTETRDKGGADDSGEAPVTTTFTDTADKVIVYYFHATRRCYTCKNIEAYSVEAIKNGFEEQLESGALEWRAVNVDLPENRHFVEDFQLATRTVVLVRVVDGVNKEWKRLDRVWELVRDKPAFVDYIWDNTNDFLADTHG